MQTHTQTLTCDCVNSSLHKRLGHDCKFHMPLTVSVPEPGSHEWDLKAIDLKSTPWRLPCDNLSSHWAADWVWGGTEHTFHVGMNPEISSPTNRRLSES